MAGDSSDWWHRQKNASSSSLKLREEEVLVRGIVGNDYGNNNNDDNDAPTWTYVVGQSTNTFALAYGNGKRDFQLSQVVIQIDYTVTMTTYNMAYSTPICQTAATTTTNMESSPSCTVPLLQGHSHRKGTKDDCWIVVADTSSDNEDDSFDDDSYGYESILLQVETKRAWGVFLGMSAIPLLLGAAFLFYSARTNIRDASKVEVRPTSLERQLVSAEEECTNTNPRTMIPLL
jgi:hypothetical protein